MKKIVFILAMLMATAMFFACGNKAETNDEDADSTDLTITDEQTEDGTVMNITDEGGENIKVEVNKDGYNVETDDSKATVNKEGVTIETKEGTTVKSRKGATEIETDK